VEWALPCRHGNSGSRNHPLFLHLTELLADRGIAVERFDRRPARYGTREQVRRAGFATAELDVLRETYEQHLRGELDRGAAQSVVDDAATRPWFDLA
jgi:predicted alpha/beta-hydrolase family hydrolase